jgi:hypothetical protein
MDMIGDAEASYKAKSTRLAKGVVGRADGKTTHFYEQRFEF